MSQSNEAPFSAPVPSQPLGTYPADARDMATAVLYQRLEAAFSPGGRWGGLAVGDNVVHQLRVSAAFLSETPPMNATPEEVTPERGAELTCLDLSKLGSILDPGLAEAFGLLACCLMSRPDSGHRQLAKRELEGAIFLAADAAARAHAGREAGERGVYTVGRGEERVCTFYPAKNIAYDISYAEAKDFVPEIPRSLEALRREVAFEQAREHFGLPAV